MAEINFLCVHKDYRVKRLTPTLIAEVTRRVNLRNKWQAVIKLYYFRSILLEEFCLLLLLKQLIGIDH